MPDLGTYAGPVLAAYGVSFLLIGGLVLVSLSSARKARQALEKQEKKRG